MNVQKKKDKFLKRLEEANAGDTVKVIKLKRKHFKDTLTSELGFGHQDLKEDSKEFFKWLVTEDYNFTTTPITDKKGDFGVLIEMVKSC